VDTGDKAAEARSWALTSV